MTVNLLDVSGNYYLILLDTSALEAVEYGDEVTFFGKVYDTSGTVDGGPGAGALGEAAAILASDEYPSSKDMVIVGINPFAKVTATIDTSAIFI